MARTATARRRAAGESANRFRVVHKPTRTAALGNWAVVNRTTGRIVARLNTREAAQQHAASRGSAVRRSRRSRGRRA